MVNASCAHLELSRTFKYQDPCQGPPAFAATSTEALGKNLQGGDTKRRQAPEPLGAFGAKGVGGGKAGVIAHRQVSAGQSQERGTDHDEDQNP